MSSLPEESGVSAAMIAEVTEHVNATHRTELTIIARANGAASAQDALLIGFDLAGLDLHAQINNRPLA